MENRVLRFFKRPGGHYHGSVFYQLSGGVGPSCLALDAQGSLYIGQFETRGIQFIQLIVSSNVMKIEITRYLSFCLMPPYPSPLALNAMMICCDDFRCSVQGRGGIRSVSPGPAGSPNHRRRAGDLRGGCQVSQTTSLYL